MNIYVGNLSYNTTEEGLKGLFEQHGTVETARVITDKITGRSRGFGFISMPNDEEGAQAVEALNNFEYDGRALRVSQANNKEGGDAPHHGGPRSFGGGGYGRGGDRGGRGGDRGGRGGFGGRDRGPRY